MTVVYTHGFPRGSWFFFFLASKHWKSVRVHYCHFGLPSLHYVFFARKNSCRKFPKNFLKNTLAFACGFFGLDGRLPLAGTREVNTHFSRRQPPPRHCSWCNSMSPPKCGCSTWVPFFVFRLNKKKRAWHETCFFTKVRQEAAASVLGWARASAAVTCVPVLIHV